MWSYLQETIFMISGYWWSTNVLFGGFKNDENMASSRGDQRIIWEHKDFALKHSTILAVENRYILGNSWNAGYQWRERKWVRWMLKWLLFIQFSFGHTNTITNSNETTLGWNFFIKILIYEQSNYSLARLQVPCKNNMWKISRKWKSESYLKSENVKWFLLHVTVDHVTEYWSIIGQRIFNDSIFVKSTVGPSEFSIVFKDHLKLLA